MVNGPGMGARRSRHGGTGVSVGARSCASGVTAGASGYWDSLMTTPPAQVAYVCNPQSIDLRHGEAARVSAEGPRWVRVRQELQMNALQPVIGALVQAKLPVCVQQLVERPPD